MSSGDPVVWFLIGLVLVIIEFFLPGVILVFFGIGAFVAALTTWIGLTRSLPSQLIVFAVGSLLLVLSLLRWVRNRFLGHASQPRNGSTDLDDFSGKIVKVIRNISPGSRDGRVEYKGTQWTALSNEEISEGDLAEILETEGIVLKVRKVKREDRS